MVCGTDAGVRDTPFSMTWAELAWMEQAGMAAREAIGTATRNAARVLKIDGETGSIAPGLSADLIVLGRSPLEDLAAFVSPHAVLLKGMWMRHATSVMSEKSDA